MSKERIHRPRSDLPRTGGDGVLGQLRAELRELEDALGELEQRPHADRGADAGDYLGYERQFRDFERRRASFAARLSDAESARRDAAWAALVSELELAWRDLLPRLERVRARRT